MDSCLFIHGFTGGEHEISPLSRFMEEHNYHTRTFTLKGHGGTRRDLLQSDRHGWQSSAEAELKELLKLQDNIHLVGFSAGALIASRLSVQYKSRVKSLTLLSAPVFLLNPLEIFRTLGSRSMLGKYVSKFGSTPPKATWELWKMVRENFAVYPQIETPTLIVQGRRDHLVRAKSANYLQRAIPSEQKKIVWADNSGHLVCHCKDKEQVMHEILHFIQNTG